METIGNRICKFRKMKGLTQEDLAKELGVSAQAVSKWEKDASCPDIGLLPKLCKVLDITSDELLTGKSDTVRLAQEDEKKSLEDMVLRVRIITQDGDRIRVNLPMPLVKISMELGLDMTPNVNGVDALKNVDFQQILKMAESGALGKLVEIETTDGDMIEVVVE